MNGSKFGQSGYNLSFLISEVAFKIQAIGAHNMENALAAIAVARHKGISMEECYTNNHTFSVNKYGRI